MKKKITKEQKLKQKIDSLQKSLKSAEDNRDYWIRKHDDSKEDQVNQIKTIEKTYKNIEGMLLPIKEENIWLKDTLRLIIVPKGREEEIAKILEERRRRMSY